MKTYNSPMLQVVSIKCNDIVTGSPVLTTTEYTSGEVLGAGRRYNVFDEWYEGY